MSDTQPPAPATIPQPPVPQMEQVVGQDVTPNQKAKKKTFLFPSLGKTVQAGSTEEASQEIKKTDEYKQFTNNNL